MSEPRVKYPRTPHLPTSRGATPDDVSASAELLDTLGRSEVVVTEKMDGECTTLYRDGFHARSIDSRHHPSRDWLAGFHATIAADIPAGLRICGENLYAQHSMRYDNLPTYFEVFSIWEGDRCLPWDDTVDWCDLLGLTHVPVLHRGPMPSLADLEANWETRLGPTRSEGYVVRAAGGFARDQFATHVAKHVREGHVTTDTHWAYSQIIPNEITC